MNDRSEEAHAPPSTSVWRVLRWLLLAMVLVPFLGGVTLVVGALGQSVNGQRVMESFCSEVSVGASELDVSAAIATADQLTFQRTPPLSSSAPVESIQAIRGGFGTGQYGCLITFDANQRVASATYSIID